LGPPQPSRLWGLFLVLLRSFVIFVPVSPG